MRRVHDVAARRGDDALRRLLARRARAPPRALHELDVGGLEEDRDGERGQHGVRQPDPF